LKKGKATKSPKSPLIEKQKKIMLHSPSSSFTSLALKTVRGFGRVGFSGSRVSGSAAAFSCSAFVSAVSSFSY